MCIRDSILIAYFSTNQILEKLKDDPGLFIFGGAVMLAYGIISYVKEKKSYKKQLDEELEDDNIQKNNYLGLFFKGFLLNFINIGAVSYTHLDVYKRQLLLKPNLLQFQLKFH